MKKSAFVAVLTLGLVWLSLWLSTTSTVQAGDKEEMMWRGTITIELMERQLFEIEMTDSRTGSWSRRTRDHITTQTATIQVISADPLHSGKVEASGPVQLYRKMVDIEQSRGRCGSSDYREETREGLASVMLEGKGGAGGAVRIGFIKRSHIEGAKAIEQAVQNCGMDLECLSRIHERFKHLLEDPSGSFPIQVHVQCFPQCQGKETLTSRFERVDCKGRTERKSDSHDISMVCFPMAIDIEDGTYIRGEEGDRITATFFESGIKPYTGPDGNMHPIETTVRCVVNLTNGPPEVKIYMATESGYEDITDKDQDILVGQKVRLSAHVVSTGLGIELDGKWEIPGEIVREWMGSQMESYLRPVKDPMTGTIDFAWYKGSKKGERRTVKYRVKFGNKALEAKTNFSVYEPEVPSVNMETGQFVGFGIGQDGCELIGGSPAVKIESTVRLAGPFSGQRFCLFYVQKVASECWGLSKPGFPSFEWVRVVHDWKLDTSFPYNGYNCSVGENRFMMQDTPGFPLANLASAYAHMAFEDYLMFIPPMPMTKAGVVPVPLKKMEWRWTGSALPEGDPYPRTIPPCGEGHKVDCSKPPSSCGPSINEAEEYPEWIGFIAKPIPTPVMGLENVKDPKAPLPSGSKWSCK